ncbi:hypothetical protein HUJ04_004613 [Dendroctonus ponderosae]|nr:hypothetical protein HUJ04_004613 [Dendroctonus ponderosae]
MEHPEHCTGRAARGKKHKSKEGIIKKIVRVVKSAIYALTLLLMQLSVLMMFNSFVGFKFLLVAMWGLGLLALKIYLDHKNEGGTVVVHEDVHHDHHYEDHDHIAVDDWHRNYLPKQDLAQKLAYSAQKPTDSVLHGTRIVHQGRKKGDKNENSEGFQMYLIGLMTQLAMLKLFVIAGLVILGILIGLVAFAVKTKLYVVAIIYVGLQAIKNQLDFGHLHQ